MRDRAVRTPDGDPGLETRRAGDATVLARDHGVGERHRLVAGPVSRVRLRQVQLEDEQAAGLQRRVYGGERAGEVAVPGQLVDHRVHADGRIDGCAEVERAQILLHQHGRGYRRQRRRRHLGARDGEHGR